MKIIALLVARRMCKAFDREELNQQQSFITLYQFML